jgi:hypothetical protein
MAAGLVALGAGTAGADPTPTPGQNMSCAAFFAHYLGGLGDVAQIQVSIGNAPGQFISNWAHVSHSESPCQH